MKLLLLTTCLLGGCATLSTGSNALVAVSTEGRTRLELDAPLALYTPTSRDDGGARHSVFGVTPHVTYRPDVDGVGAGMGFTGGYSAISGTTGWHAMVSAGWTFELADRDASSRDGRFFLRVHGGLDLTTSESQWQRVDDPDFPGDVCVADGTHHVFSLVGGIELMDSIETFVATVPTEWNVLFGLGYRYVDEPTCGSRL